MTLMLLRINYTMMACKLNSILTPHIHWIVRPKTIMPMAQTPTTTMAYLALEIAYFSFVADSFARIASTFLKISTP